MIFYTYILFERVCERMRVIMKRVLMAALCFSCVTWGSQAIDINIPGADPTISKDAYQNYRKTGNEVQKTENIIANQIRDEYNNNGSKNGH